MKNEMKWMKWNVAKRSGCLIKRWLTGFRRLLTGRAELKHNICLLSPPGFFLLHTFFIKASGKDAPSEVLSFRSPTAQNTQLYLFPHTRHSLFVYFFILQRCKHTLTLYTLCCRILFPAHLIVSPTRCYYFLGVFGVCEGVAPEGGNTSFITSMTVFPSSVVAVCQEL